MPDEIANLMDFSTVVEFLESLHTIPLVKRMFGWKKNCNETIPPVKHVRILNRAEFYRKIEENRRKRREMEDRELL